MEHLKNVAKANELKKKLSTIALEVIAEETIDGCINFYFVDA